MNREGNSERDGQCGKRMRTSEQPAARAHFNSLDLWFVQLLGPTLAHHSGARQLGYPEQDKGFPGDRSVP